MESKIEKNQKAVVFCDEIITEGNTRKRLKVEYNLRPITEIIEFGGIDHVIDSLREIQFKYSLLALEAYESTDENLQVDNELPGQLFFLKLMTECFEIIKNETYQRKDWPVVQELVVN
jgi:hypothetical protein